MKKIYQQDSYNYIVKTPVLTNKYDKLSKEEKISSQIIK
jgi:hypothetical protein